MVLIKFSNISYEVFEEIRKQLLRVPMALLNDIYIRNSLEAYFTVLDGFLPQELEPYLVEVSIPLEVMDFSKIILPAPGV